MPLRRAPWSSDFEGAISVLERAEGLTPAQAARLRSLVRRVRRHPADGVLPGREGREMRLWVLSGWAAEERSLPGGGRQIFGFLLPGDVGLCRARGDGAQPYVLRALTRLVTVDLDEVLGDRDLPERAELWMAMDARLRRQEAWRQAQLTWLREAPADERLLALLLEFEARLGEAGLVRADGYRLPLRQTHLADALGLSPWHINRTLRRLRDLGLVTVQYGGVKQLRPDGLQVLQARRSRPANKDAASADPATGQARD